jgi:diadenosine tetraphosphate (Ap4A) HIT family hydrolase
MTTFSLNQHLDNDCITLGTFGRSHLLLFNNSLVPWFILVPETEGCEIFDMKPDEQTIIFDEINQLGRFVAREFNTDKVNTAAIGNIVRQLHIHVVGRYEDDYCWPNVVWGNTEKKSYTTAEIQSIIIRLTTKVDDYFNPACEHITN